MSFTLLECYDTLSNIIYFLIYPAAFVSSSHKYLKCSKYK